MGQRGANTMTLSQYAAGDLPDADPHSDASLFRAFNLGSDSRIAGLAESSCPYRHNSVRWSYWRSGWRHVDTCWGADVKSWRELTLMKLPALSFP